MQPYPQGVQWGIGFTLIALLVVAIGEWKGDQTTAIASPPAGSPVFSDTKETTVANATEPDPSGLIRRWQAALSTAVTTGAVLSVAELARDATQQETEIMLADTRAVDDRDIRFDLRLILLGRLAHWDGMTAATFIESLPIEDRLPALTAVVAGVWGATHSAAAVDWFDGSASRGELEESAAALGKALAPQSLATVKMLLASIEGEGVRFALNEAIIQQWKHRRPAEAAQLAMEALSVEESGILLGRIIPDWAQSDLKSVVDWAKRLPAGDHRLMALVHLSQPWAAADVNAATAFARTLPPGNEQFTASVLSHWVQHDPVAASTWATRLPENAVRDRVTASVVSEWARRDPSAAAAFSLSLPSTDGRQNALVSVISSWATHDPPAAAAWSVAFPTGQSRAYAIASATSGWMLSDPVAAMSWIQRLPAIADRDMALNVTAGSMVKMHPDLAITLATAISDETLSAVQADRAASAWLASDPAAATTWIANASLPHAVKIRLLQLHR